MHFIFIFYTKTNVAPGWHIYGSCSCSSWADPLQKACGSVVLNRIRMKFDRIVLQVFIEVCIQYID